MKGQFSVEYLLIVAFALVILTPVVFYAYSSFSESQQQIGVSAVNQMGYQVVNTAKNVFFLGAFSKVTLEMNFPEGLQNITVEQSGSSYYFVVKYGESEVTFPSDVPIAYIFDSKHLNQGIKQVRLEYNGTTDKVDILIL